MRCEEGGEMKMKHADKSLGMLPRVVLCLAMTGVVSLTVFAVTSLGCGIIQRQVISSGGAVKSNSAHFDLSWTIGQPWAESASSDNFGLKHGFWHEAVAASEYLCGDANADETINVADAVFIISYIFKGGPAPDPLCVADANGDGTVNIADAVYLITYIFKGGPPPVEDCCP
jgi:hypothetical protein